MIGENHFGHIFDVLLARKLNELEVLVQIVPLVILLRPLLSRLDVGLLGNVESLGSILAADIRLAVRGVRSLVDGDLILHVVTLALDEVLPETVALLKN